MRVKDDGGGIAADMIDRIFEPLVTTKRGQGRNGLGLAISRRIVNASDGDMSVQSTPRRGGRVLSFVPAGGYGRQRQKMKTVSSRHTDHANPDRRRRRSTADVLDAVLRREGFDIVSASTGEELLNIVETEEVDLVILDIMLPTASIRCGRCASPIPACPSSSSRPSRRSTARSRRGARAAPARS